MNKNYGKLIDGAVKYAPNNVKIDNVIYGNPTAAQYLACGWKAVVDERPTTDAEHYAVAVGWADADTTITRQYEIREVERVPRVFSKLKCYGALVTLGKWAEVKAWLEAQNLWDAFLLAQDVREDNDYFVAGLAQFKAQFGMDDAAVEAILSQCVAEG